ncbi:MAG: glucose 1-dehydrogenase [Acidobacteria bacterium]|nr:MAG: glucose 1-dehydrogenase [Acidobacteriota bacterium]
MEAIATRLAGKNALVTGSSQGIGEAVAIRLAEEGANVVVNYHSHAESADRVVETIKKLGRKSVALGADLGRIEEIQRLIQESVRELGCLDILVNNAAMQVNADFLKVTDSDYDRVLGVNLKGMFFSAQVFVRHLIETRRPGKIINMRSVHEELPFPHFAPYSMSKGGLKMMTRTLAIELAPFGITINSIAPGAIETPINTKLLNDPAKLNALLRNIPLKRLGKPGDVAGAVVFLASSDADYMTGATVFVDGGLLWNFEEQ